MWAYRTDWAGQVPTRPNTVFSIVGLVTTPQLEPVPEASIEGVAEFRQRHQLVSNDRPGEGSRSVTALGYFRLDGQIIGVFHLDLWAGERFVIYRVGGAGEQVATRYGGGC
jgi:hypothetical protein